MRRQRREAWRSAAADYPSPDPVMPILQWTEVPVSLETFWDEYVRVWNWPEWNRSIAHVAITGNELRAGTWMFWVFNSFIPAIPYKLPVGAQILDFDVHRKITWDVHIPGVFSAKHATLFEDCGSNRCRVGWWELAEGPAYRLLRPFFLAHFRYVCRETFVGAAALACTLSKHAPSEAMATPKASVADRTRAHVVN